MRNPKNSMRQMFGSVAAILTGLAAAGPSWAASWTAVNSGLPNLGLGVTALTVDPKSSSTIYAQTNPTQIGLSLTTSLFKTTDGGETWSAVSSILSPGALAVDPQNPSTLYAGSERGVLKSANGGATWTDASSGLPGGARVMRLAIDPLTPLTIYAILSGTVPNSVTANVVGTFIFKSTNGGASWAALDTGVPAGAFVSALAIDPAAPSNLYIVVPPFFIPNTGPSKGLVMKSTDGGESWNPLDLGLPPGPPSAFPNSLVIDSSSNLYAVVPQFGGPTPSGAILKSTDGGSTWKALPPLPAGTTFGILIADPADASRLYVIATMITPVPPGPPPVPTGPKYVIIKTTDGGQHWNVYDPGLPTNTVLSSLALDPSDPSKIYAGFAGFPGAPLGLGGGTIPPGGVLRSGDGGQSWSDASAGLFVFDIRALAMSPAGSGALYAGGPSGVLRSDDGGANWNPTAMTDYTGSLVADSLNIYAQTGRANGCSSDARLLFRSDDGGASWSDSVSPLNSGCILSATFAGHAAPLVISPTDPKTLYLAESDDGDGYSAILKATDGGTNWFAVWDWFTGLRASVRALAIDPARATTIYAGLDDGTATSPAVSGAAGSGGLFKSTDGGLTWTNTGVTRAAVSLVAIDPANSSIVYAAAEGHYADPSGFQGLFKSTNGGGTWQAVGKGLDSVTGSRLTTATALKIDPVNSNILYLGTSNAGVFRSADGGSTWIAFNDSLGNLQIRSLSVARGTPRTVYAGTPGGVFKILDQ